MRLAFDMVRSEESTRTPLGIDPLYQSEKLDPQNPWEKWRSYAKLALLAKKNVDLQKLLGPMPRNVDLTKEAIY